MSTSTSLCMTAEEFYEWEELQLEKHQYYQGRAYSMSCSSITHNQLCINLISALMTQLKGSDDEVFGLSLMVHTPSGLNTYPDLFVIRGELEFDDKKCRVVTNPRMIIEVLSPSTEIYDRGLKFDHYKTIPSLQEYLLVEQDRVAVDHYTRTENGWLAQDARTLEASVVLACQGVALKLKDIYENIEIPPAEDPNTAQLKIYGDER